MKTNFKNFQKSLKIYKKRRHYSMKENEKDILSKLQNHKEERLELFDKKIKEKFAMKEEFFKNFRFKEETFKKRMFEGSLPLNYIYKTGELLDITLEELMFLYFGETPEEQNKFLIPEEMIEGESEEVKNFLRETNQILRGKSIEGREIFLNDLQKTIEKDLKGSEEE